VGDKLHQLRETLQHLQDTYLSPKRTLNSPSDEI
jgi:hypothetical protein